MVFTKIATLEVKVVDPDIKVKTLEIKLKTLARKVETLGIKVKTVDFKVVDPGTLANPGSTLTGAPTVGERLKGNSQWKAHLGV